MLYFYVTPNKLLWYKFLAEFRTTYVYQWSYGRQIKEDYYSSNELSTIFENSLDTLSPIARTPRSYFIGLKGSDLEVVEHFYTATWRPRTFMTGWWHISNVSRFGDFDRFNICCPNFSMFLYLEAVVLNPSVIALAKAVTQLKICWAGIIRMLLLYLIKLFLL
jgi:hypothetical protein